MLAMHPNLKIIVNQRQNNSFSKKLRSFRINQEVMFRSYNSPKPWLQGVISAKLGALHYLVKYKNQQHKRHIDQLLSCGITLDRPSPSNCNTDVRAADATTRKRVKFFPVSNATSSPQPKSTFTQTSPLAFSDRSKTIPCQTSHDEISNKSSPTLSQSSPKNSSSQSSPKNSSSQSSPKNSSIQSSPKNSSIQCSPKNSSISSSRNLPIQSSPDNSSTQSQSTSNQPSQRGSPTQSTSGSSSSPNVSPQHLKSPISQHAESSSQFINVTPKNVPISKPNKGRGRGVSKATKKQFSVKPGVSTFGRIVKPKEPYSPE
nr:PREDICTED: probable serine/threonine-protein kinase nek3 [Bemisia tabaci]